jgi:hypothetical protein
MGTFRIFPKFECVRRDMRWSRLNPERTVGGRCPSSLRSRLTTSIRWSAMYTAIRCGQGVSLGVRHHEGVASAGTLRRESLGWLIPLSDAYLRRTLKSWIAHYNCKRPHSALAPGGILDPPENLSVPLPNSPHRLEDSRSVHAKAIRGDLQERGARIADAEVSKTRCVVRAVAPLARRRRHSQHVRSLTDGKALDVMWFSHYAPAVSVLPHAALLM